MNPTVQRFEGHLCRVRSRRSAAVAAANRTTYYAPPPPPPPPPVYVHPVIPVNPYAVYTVGPGYYQPINFAPQFPIAMTYGYRNYAQTRSLSTQLSWEDRIAHKPTPHMEEMLNNGYARFGPKTLVPDGPSGPKNVEKQKPLDVHMPFEQLFENILEQLKQAPCRVTWLNRLLAKCTTAIEFNKSLHAFKLFQLQNVEPSSETGTLLIKAACRAGVPEKALAMLKDVEGYRFWPTLGGIHYLMISFCLKKDTKSVVETFHTINLRKLKPSTRTYHILIRECVDQGMIDEAKKFTNECKEKNISPNRVTYNILMNGYRKFNRPEEILQLRDQMDEKNIITNDTTVKFTTLAYMMLGETDKAVETFLGYNELETKAEEFCEKFFEITVEDEVQQKCVLKLFEAVAAKGFNVPPSITKKISELQEGIH